MTKKKAAPSQPLPEDLVPADFIYCGRRILDGKLAVCIRVIDGPPENLTAERLGPERFFWHEKHHTRLIIGGIYRGAKFNEGHCISVPVAEFLRLSKIADAMLWQAKDEQTEIEIKARRIENDAKRYDPIAAALKPLRRYYSSLLMHSDRDAFVLAVERALRRPITTKEK